MNDRHARLTVVILSAAMFYLTPACDTGGPAGSGGGEPGDNQNTADDTGDNGDESTEEFTISGETFSLGLDDLVPFDLRPESEPARQRADLTLFTEKPSDSPSTAQLTMDPEDVVVLRPDAAEGEADEITGSATVAV